MAQQISPKLQSYIDTVNQLGKAPSQGITSLDMAKVGQRQRDLSKFLGQTDYSKQLQEAQDLGKLQLALALAQQGFAAAGATPKRGEAPISTISRELFSPLAGTAGAVATQMMQQRRAIENARAQEERQLKLSALQQIQQEDALRKNLALKLMTDPTKKTDKSPFEKVLYVVSKDKDGEMVHAGPDGQPVQVRQERGSEGVLRDPINVRTKAARPLKPGEMVVSFANLSDKLKGKVTTPKSTPSATLGTIDYRLVYEKGNKKGQYYTDDAGRIPIFGSVSKAGDDLEIGAIVERGGEGVAFTLEKLKNQGLRLEKVTPDSGPTETDAQRKTEANRSFLFNSMARVQRQQLAGEFTPYSARSALWWDQAAFINGEFPFRFIPSGTPTDRILQDSVKITNPEVQSFIENKVNSLAEVGLKQNFFDKSDRVKSVLAENAVKEILSLTPETLFGSKEIPQLGTLPDGTEVGYSPTTSAFSPVVQDQAIKGAFQELKTNPDANAFETFEPVAEPDNKAAFNKPGGRVKTAVTLFPQAFGDPQKPLTPSYDADLVQRRKDIEAVLPNVKLLLNTSPEDRRQIIIEAVNKKTEARNKLQNSNAATEARDLFRTRLEFRDALLNFKNAAAEAGNVQGFITGPLVAGLSRIGLADFIAGDGAEAWARLTAASDRFQEGQSRRVGREFGDNRISNYDAEAYKKLVARISAGASFNKILIEEGLNRVTRELTGLMAIGGKVGWTENELMRAAESGVDFSNLKTMEDWHGYGFYGKDRFSVTRQQAPSLSQDQRNSITTQGSLKDTMFGGKYIVPTINYNTSVIPTFTRDTRRSIKGPLEFETWLENRANTSGVPIDVMRERVTTAIRSYNQFRNTLQ